LPDGILFLIVYDDAQAVVAHDMAVESRTADARPELIVIRALVPMTSTLVNLTVFVAEVLQVFGRSIHWQIATWIFGHCCRLSRWN